jgi:hypothetical protein
MLYDVVIVGHTCGSLCNYKVKANVLQREDPALVEIYRGEAEGNERLEEISK